MSTVVHGATNKRIRDRSIHVGLVSRWLVHSEPLSWLSFILVSAIVSAYLALWGNFPFLITIGGVQYWLRETLGFVPHTPPAYFEIFLAIFLSVFAYCAITFLVVVVSFCLYVFRNPSVISSNVSGRIARGNVAYWISILPYSWLTKIRNLHRDESEPFIICRNAYHASATWWYAFFNGYALIQFLQTNRRASPSWGTFNQLNYLITIALGRATETELRPVHDQKYIFFDQVTNRHEQKTVVREFNESDLPLRFIQAEPQRRFPSSPGHELPKPTYVFFQCQFNSISDPIWVLPLKSVVEVLKRKCDADPGGTSFAEAVRLLSLPQFPVFSRIVDQLTADALSLKRGESDTVPILSVETLKNGETRYYSGYDENQILYNLVAPLARRALLLFQQSIDEASEHAIPVYLGPGDVLMVRNQEAFTARRELSDNWMHGLPTVLPRARWLRVYYTFPRASLATTESGRVLAAGISVANVPPPMERIITTSPKA